MIAANTILQDRYRIIRLLGKGGMGAVYEAIDQRVSCVVALKETLVGPENEARQAFQREAALLANLRHSSLPKVMDYFDEPQGDFLVMEYIPGHDLAELMALRDGPFPQEQVVSWAIELLKLLEYLHTREPPILHRDIKPANLKATKQGEIFLLDFGLAKGTAGQMTTVETSKSVPGYTPVYAPLEQILGQGTDPRSDLYALGATLYHLLTGQTPVSAPARFDAIENDRLDPLRPANQLNFQIAPEVAACVQSAMSLSRKDRPSSAGKMRIDLENAARVVAARDSARKAEANLIVTLPLGPQADPAKPLVADENVQFTVYTPQQIKPEKTYSVLAFAHLSKRRADASEDEPDPIAAMKEQAARILGDQQDDYRDAKESGSQPVPRGGELTFIPVVQGINFSPTSRSFTWRKSVHREEFDMWASSEVDGKTLHGRMTVFLGSVIIAEVGLTISVNSGATPTAERISLDKAQSARRVRQVFAAYSQRDQQIVAELAHVAPIFGSRFVMDSTHLEPGEDRVAGLQRLIRDADVFQLFWSTNSMRSPETVDEIRYAASLGRPGFILPTYWEDPLPRSPGEGLPPPEIERLQFYRIYPGAILQATSGAAFESQPARTTDTVPASPQTFASAPPDEAPTGKLAPIETLLTPSPPQVPLPKAGSSSPAPTMGFASSAEPTGTQGSRSSPTIGSVMFYPSASPAGADAASPIGIVQCSRCGSKFASGVKVCGRCGGRSFQEDPSSTAINQVVAPAASLPSPTQNYQAPARRRKGLMMPIFAGAAMVLLLAILAPVWFMLSRSASKPNLTTAPTKISNTSSNSKTSSSPPAGMIYVPGGEFMMGRNDGVDAEGPAHQVTVKPFFIDMYEVTNEDYEKFVKATNHGSPSTWKNGTFPSGATRKPVTGVTWYDASDYARWTGKRIPTEEEWEFASRGTDGRRYPWGNDPPNVLNSENEKKLIELRKSREQVLITYTEEAQQIKEIDRQIADLEKPLQSSTPLANVGGVSGGLADVGKFKGASPFGIFDLVGNAWEWTASDMQVYPGGRLPANKPIVELKVIRGGSYESTKDNATTTYRTGWPSRSATTYDQTGFRCVQGIGK